MPVVPTACNHILGNLYFTTSQAGFMYILAKKIGKKNLQFAMDFFLLQLGFAAKFRKIGLRAWFPWCPAPLTDIPF